MSSSQELYNQLSEKLRELVSVKNSKQITNWIWIVVGMLQSESCHLGQIANYLPNGRMDRLDRLVPENQNRYFQNALLTQQAVWQANVSVT